MRDNSILSLAEMNFGVKCFADIRYAGVTAHMGNDHCQINISPVIREIEEISLQFASSRVDVFYE